MSINPAPTCWTRADSSYIEKMQPRAHGLIFVFFLGALSLASGQKGNDENGELLSARVDVYKLSTILL